MDGPGRSDAMTEKQRVNNKQPPWQKEGDAKAVPFGPWLRRQREMREITLREISDASKISLRYLQALEDERFDLLPAMVFAKGFLRQYARYVGLDQDEVVNSFLVACRGEDEEGEQDESEQTGAPLRRGATGNAWKYAVLIVVVAAVLLALIFLLPRLLGGKGRPTPSQPPPGMAPSGVAATEGAGSPAGAAGTGPDVADAGTATSQTAEATAPLRVTLDFREDCWVEATVDGARRVSEMRVQGESLQLQAQQVVELRLGNAGVVDIEVNGRPYPLDATPGQVRRVRIDLSDLSGGGAEGGAGARAQDVSGGSQRGVPSQP